MWGGRARPWQPVCEASLSARYHLALEWLVATDLDGQPHIAVVLSTTSCSDFGQLFASLQFSHKKGSLSPQKRFQPSVAGALLVVLCHYVLPVMQDDNSWVGELWVMCATHCFQVMMQASPQGAAVRHTASAVSAGGTAFYALSFRRKKGLVAVSRPESW